MIKLSLSSVTCSLTYQLHLPYTVTVFHIRSVFLTTKICMKPYPFEDEFHSVIITVLSSRLIKLVKKRFSFSSAVPLIHRVKKLREAGEGAVEDSARRISTLCYSYRLLLGRSIFPIHLSTCQCSANRTQNGTQLIMGLG
jgi:hypothetical protein